MGCRRRAADGFGVVAAPGGRDWLEGDAVWTIRAARRGPRLLRAVWYRPPNQRATRRSPQPRGKADTIPGHNDETVARKPRSRISPSEEFPNSSVYLRTPGTPVQRKIHENKTELPTRIWSGITFWFRASRHPYDGVGSAAVCRVQIKTRRRRQAEWIGGRNREVISDQIHSAFLE